MVSRKARFEQLKVQKNRVPIWQLTAWPALQWNQAAVQPALARAEQARLGVQAAIASIGFAGFDALNQDLWAGDALATAAIEGQDLDLSAVRSSVGHKLGLSAASQNRDVEGLIAVMQDASFQQHQAMTAQRLCQWQSWLFPDNASLPRKLQIQIGQFRSHAEPMQIISGAIGREIVHYTAPESAAVAPHMQRLLQWIEATRQNASPSPIVRPAPLIRAALAHLWFETIHPFEDGNGRIGRALCDYLLAQDFSQNAPVFSLSHQIQKERSAYYDELAAAQFAALSPQGGIEVTPWVLWFIEVFQRGCEHTLACIQIAQKKAFFWQNASAHHLNERERKILQRLLDAGDEGFEGGLSAEKYMRITGASKATATRDLSHLYACQLLGQRGQGKATRYAVALPGWNASYPRLAS